jgi:dynein heavy chain, axonemal
VTDKEEEEGENLLVVNFDKMLDRLLREVKYLRLLNIPVPEKAKHLYDKVDIYRTQTGNLHLIVDMYNEILTTLLPVEKPLLKDRIERIDSILKPGIEKLKWSDTNIDPFIKEAMVEITDVSNLVKKMKENVRKMEHMMKGWCRPLYDRKNKPMSPDDLEQTHGASVDQRLSNIKDEGKEINKLLKDTMDHIKPSKKSVEWIAYQDYINCVIIQGITKAIVSSIKHLSEQISIEYNRHNDLQPMFDVKVCLGDNDVVFDPSIRSTNSENGIKDILFRIVDGFISISCLIQRLDSQQLDYLVEVKDQHEIFFAMSHISKNMRQMEIETDKFIEKYGELSFLWKEDIEVSFRQFLEGAGEMSVRMKPVEGGEDGEMEEDESYKWMAEKILNGITVNRPSLDQFDEKITYLSSISAKIQEMETSSPRGWLKINSQPLKDSLSSIINSWIKKYTKFLLDNTQREINNMIEFTREVSEGIKKVPGKVQSQEEKDILMKVMTHLRDVKMIKDHTLNEIIPMKETVQLLKKHGVQPEEDLLLKIENSKTSLIEVSEKALGPIKEQILPLQTQEGTNIKKQLDEFSIKVQKFREEFQSKCPYHVKDTSNEIIDKAYETISLYYDKTIDFEMQAKRYNNLETLFELQKSAYSELKECKNELKSLKYMWDLIQLVHYQFNAWKLTLWDKIDTDYLLAQIKELQKKQVNPINPINKEIKSWGAFSALNERVKNMAVILPLISDLHSKSMMNRHWKRLMAITGKNIAFSSPKFCLEDLIQLELYKYSDEVNELVDSANKELRIETNLGKIANIWEEQVLNFKEFKGCYIIGALDETIEFLDDHQMQLMGMMSQKDVEEFKETVIDWQRKLKNVDTVIQIWMKVQKNWQRLETIFLASEDIKAQLPEDTKRFQKVDTDWRNLMTEAADESGVVVACNYEGREDLLFEMHGEIELCEKSLNNYLEQKKKIFSRFYFVSNQALLDILSNGNNPEIVNGYLGDCFNGMKAVKFVETEQRPYRVCEGMISKENEYVSFGDHFEFVGAVENYLCDLETKMMKTLRNIAEQARGTAENWDLENKRHYWLEDYCAQISLLITQIIWTEEVNRAFEELESGGELAMKNYLQEIKNRIGFLIARIREDLSSELRDKIITIITIDVHERDVVSSFVDKKIEDSGSFAWQVQLKFYWEQKRGEDLKHCFARICDYACRYSYEYVGNCGRLVITPLTDRCYITLTQALNLTMGGAPAGPAGTGKTETVKDLGRALGLPVVVFNCSDQMNYESMAQIFLGLSQSGSWGCFDEFNRISIEVLSVVSTQVKTVLDAMKECLENPSKTTFTFNDDEVRLRMSVGFFITMNPGYAGRTELPENLKALFRSCAMVVPDIILICENMLMSEGFVNAKELSEKFMTLYTLCKSLLSIQIHYDWGLRAVKSVLRQAGGLKRQEPDAPEQRVLMRALRDFNLPKIVSYDRMIFLGLINDLFPNIDAKSKTNEVLREAVEQMTLKNKKQAEEMFVKKCIDFYDILQVRHCMFIIGNAGSAKTTIWKILADALNHLGQKTVYEFADPKAVTSDELFGCMNPKTKEWKDGVLSTIMRDMNRNNGRFTTEQAYKWVILDGDVDPEWIESLNTVMDDNKVLTLVSQERIPLTPEMRMILEVSHLNNATPATVSRGGVLFINDTDVGWRPYIDSWMDKLKEKKDTIVTTVFYLAISYYMSEDILEAIANYSTVTPCVTIAYIKTMCCIIDALYENLYEKKEYVALMKNLKTENDEENIKRIYEAFFIYSFMWSFGAACDDDSFIGFNSMLKNKAKVKFPDQGLCYDFYFDPLKNDWVHWQEKVPNYEPQYDQLYQNIVVPTADTIKHMTLLELHMLKDKPVLYVGSAGTGKTTIIKDYFLNVDKETAVVASINFNSYTDSKDLQAVMESNVDKRAGSTFGPPPNHILIYFMDDINMPLVDKYGTQGPICLIRQLIDYGIIFDRDHLEEKKKLVDCRYTACMNPKAGSFKIDIRLQRHYSVFACLTTSAEILKTIYGQLLDSHFTHFDQNISQLSGKFIDAITTVFNGIVKTPQFYPTAKKFHYQFNLRDFSKIVQNMLLAEPQLYRNQPEKLYRLWLHECNRVYLDRLIFEEDVTAYMKFVTDAGKKFDIKEEQLFEQPIIYTSFVSASQGHEKAYLATDDIDVLKKVLEDKLFEYNDTNAAMELVLFQQAMEHI